MFLYALYQVGMCPFTTEIGDIDRDQTETIKAKKEGKNLFAPVIRKVNFPLMAEKLIREWQTKTGGTGILCGAGFI